MNDNKKAVSDGWTKYEVELKVREKLYGGKPKDPALIKGWLESRSKELKRVEMESMVKQVEDQAKKTKEVLVGDEEGEYAEGMWTGFFADDDGLYIEDYQVKAMLKDSGDTLDAVKKTPAWRKWVNLGLFVKPKKIYLGRKEPDGFEDRAIHVMTRIGPRNALKRQDYVTKPTVRFILWVAEESPLKAEHVQMMLKRAEEQGLGASKSQGAGQFDLKKLTALKA